MHKLWRRKEDGIIVAAWLHKNNTVHYRLKGWRAWDPYKLFIERYEPVLNCIECGTAKVRYDGLSLAIDGKCWSCK